MNIHIFYGMIKADYNIIALRGKEQIYFSVPLKICSFSLPLISVLQISKKS